MAATIKRFTDGQMLRLKKEISSPLVSIPAGTTKEAGWFSHMIGADVSQWIAPVRRKWFDLVN